MVFSLSVFKKPVHRILPQWAHGPQAQITVLQPPVTLEDTFNWILDSCRRNPIYTVRWLFRHWSVRGGTGNLIWQLIMLVSVYLSPQAFYISELLVRPHSLYFISTYMHTGLCQTCFGIPGFTLDYQPQAGIHHDHLPLQLFGKWF